MKDWSVVPLKMTLKWGTVKIDVVLVEGLECGATRYQHEVEVVAKIDIVFMMD